MIYRKNKTAVLTIPLSPLRNDKSVNMINVYSHALLTFKSRIEVILSFVCVQ